MYDSRKLRSLIFVCGAAHRLMEAHDKTGQPAVPLLAGGEILLFQGLEGTLEEVVRAADLHLLRLEPKERDGFGNVLLSTSDTLTESEKRMCLNDAWRV